MATSNSANETTNCAPPNVEGWASDMRAHEAGPTIVASPDASAQNLIAWAHAQVEQLNVLLKVIGLASHSPGEIDPAELVGSIRHQLEQVQCVMGTALDRMSDGAKPATH